MSKLKLTTSISIQASPEKVWQGLTDPALIRQYFFGTNAISDWKEGSSLRFTGEWEGQSYEDKGTILKSEKNRLLSYSYLSSMSGKEDIPENYATVTYALTPQGKGTLLTITQDPVDSQEALEHSEQNWQMVMKGMAELIEEK